MSENNFNQNNQRDDDSVDLSKVFRSILMQSKLVLLIIFSITAISVVYYINSERTYKITSLVQVLPQQNVSSFSRVTAGELFLGGTSSTNVDSIMQLFKSRENMLDVTDHLDLNIEFHDVNYEERNFIKNFNFKDFPESNSQKLTLKLNEDEFKILNDNNEILLSGDYGQSISNDYVDVFIENPSSNLAGKTLKITAHDPDIYYEKVLDSISVESALKSTYTFLNTGAIIEVSYITPDIDLGIALVNYANQNFISKSIENESMQARKAINFIDNRVAGIEKNLTEKKNTLQDFKKSNNTVDVELETESIVASLKTLETKINEIDLEIESAKTSFTVDNPIYVNLLNQKTTILGQKELIEQRINQLPLSQQRYIDILRDLEIIQGIYNQLQNRRLELSLQEASTLGNMRIVDSAYMSSLVSPQITFIILSFFVSFFIALLVAIIRGMFFLPISNPAELQDSNILEPIVGVINRVGDISQLEDDERFSQSIESLIVNIQNKLNEIDYADAGKSIVVTSPTPSNGKSFVSLNVAKRLAALGNKVLLIDADYKRGNQHDLLNKPKITYEKFFNIDANFLDEFKTEFSNLYLVPKLSKLKSSFDFLYDPRYKEKFESFKKEFDYIVIDTAPILSVSDTSILVSSADLNLSVVRHGYSKINEIKQMLSLYSQIGRKSDGIVYNSYEKPSSYYGYYGLYGNYAYQYYSKRYLYQTYDYESKKN